MRLFNAIRDRLRKAIFTAVGLPRDDFLIIEKETSSIAHVGVIGYRWGFIPVYGVKKGNRQSLRDFFGGILRKRLIVSAIHENHESTPVVVDMVSPLKEEVTRRIAAIERNHITLAEESVLPFYDGFLAEFLNNDRNGFRKELLERIKSASSNIFVAQLKKRIAQLALKVKEVTIPDVRYTKKRILVATNDIAFPPGTKFVFSGNGKTYYVIEQPPQVRTVGWNNKEHAGRWAFAFPYIVFIVVIGNKKKDFITLHAFYRNEPLSGVSDDLFFPALPDVMHGKYDNGERFSEVCFPGTEISGNVDAVVSSVLQSFWNSDFQMSVHQGSFFPLYKTKLPQIWELKKWHAATKKDPQFVLSLPWIPAGVTLEGAVEEIAKTHGAKSMPIELDIDATVEILAKKVSQEIQEACFFLLPHWSIPQVALGTLTEEFAQVLHTYFQSLKNLSEEHISSVLQPIEDVLTGEQIMAFVQESLSDPELNVLFETAWVSNGKE